MHEAIMGGYLKIVELLIEHGQDVNSQLGGSLLNLAVICNNIKIVEMLLKKGAKINYMALGLAKKNAKLYDILKKARDAEQEKSTQTPNIKTIQFKHEYLRSRAYIRLSLSSPLSLSSSHRYSKYSFLFLFHHFQSLFNIF